MDRKALRNISYGLYIVCSKKGDKWNGQIANTIIQITSDPVTIAVSINKENLTHQYLQDSKVFSVSVLTREVSMKTIGHFGFKSGKDIDKFKDLNCDTGVTRTPLIKENTISCLEAEVIDSVKVGTHTIFVGKLLDARIVGEGEPMTYTYYHQVKKGKAPKTAPTYQAEAKERKYTCTVCGYIYEPKEGDPENGISPSTSFESIPEDWVCPICGAGKNAFEITKQLSIRAYIMHTQAKEGCHFLFYSL